MADFGSTDGCLRTLSLWRKAEINTGMKLVHNQNLCGSLIWLSLTSNGITTNILSIDDRRPGRSVQRT